MPMTLRPGTMAARADVTLMRARDVLGERDDARRLGAARRLELEQGDDGAGLDLAHLALDREVGEHLLEQARGAAQHGLREAPDPTCAAAGRRKRLIEGGR